MINQSLQYLSKWVAKSLCLINREVFGLGILKEYNVLSLKTFSSLIVLNGSSTCSNSNYLCNILFLNYIFYFSDPFAICFKIEQLSTSFSLNLFGSYPSR